MFNFFNLLEETGTQTTPTSGFSNPTTWIIIGGIVVLFIVVNFLSSRQRRKQEDADKEKKSKLAPGFKVTTIGGIVGTVVAVDNDNNTFTIETGIEDRTSVITFDKQALYNMVDPNEQNAVEETSVQEVSEVAQEVEEENAQENSTETKE